MIDSGYALIFDLDGVIIHSNPVHREAWRLYTRRFGIETDEAMEQRMFGRRNDDIVRDFFGSELAAEAIAGHGAAKESLYREIMQERLMGAAVPGVTDFLQNYAAWAIGLATNAEPANVDFVLDGIEVAGRRLRSFFRVSVDGSQVRRPKPDPEIYLVTARRLGFDPRNCIVFEDSHAGVEAARAAGAKVVALRTTHSEFKNIDLAVDDFLDPELEQWLRAQKAAA
jgi:HAD superfamily hydrolase (TIGR01509 family)